MPTRLKLEQWRQARRIHGGLVPMLGAALGVKLARVPIPGRQLRRRLLKGVFGGKYPAVNERELDRPLEEFRSLNDVFTRGVRAGSRNPWPPFAGFVSPCDGRIQQAGTLRPEAVLTAKGIGYQLDSLAPRTNTEPFHGGRFAVVFLAPSDCHRVFAPASGRLTAVTHVPGSRLLVHPHCQRPEFPVFTLNERLVLELETDFGPALVVMVAGWGVGCMTFPFESPVSPQRRQISHVRLAEPRSLVVGEWLATFELGSTVILITGPGEPCPEVVWDDDPVRFGQPLFPGGPGSELPTALDPAGGLR
jgi:phosphatidylserine decarboxylase